MHQYGSTNNVMYNISHQNANDYFVLWCAVSLRCVNQVLKINTNYSVLPDDDMSKVSKRVRIVFIMWITVHSVLCIVRLL
jgi:hypothetical protein